MNHQNLNSQDFFQQPPGRFIKYHATGNDFILMALEDLTSSFQREVAQFAQSISSNITQPWSSWIQFLCRPHLGIGADGVLLYSRQTAQVSIFNADGSAAAFCANGTRCAFHAVSLHRHSRGPLIMHTAAGEYLARFDQDNPHTVLLSYPAKGFKLLECPAIVDQSLPADWSQLKRWWVNSGVPHLYLQIDPKLTSVEALAFWHHPDFILRASHLRRHPALGPEGSNVSLWWYDAEHQCSYLRTFERGVEGQTLSCGSAVMGLGFLQHHLKLGTSPILPVHCPGGQLQVSYNASKQTIEYGGPVTALYDGTLRSLPMDVPHAL